MTSKVKISIFSISLTIIVLVFLIVMMVMEMARDRKTIAYIIAALLVISCGFALYYTPMELKATESQLEICRSIAIKPIPYSAVESVTLCPPTMAEKRLFASGGFFGYWGWFSEPGIGKYFAYYGKSSDCFLITLKSGKKYVLGCENAPQMVDFISSRLK
ncbi:MAG: PH domain-containing protein [Paramuribaculum sp.]|nr:PH domain-containing protein [Paramuribaculum sp.]